MQVNVLPKYLKEYLRNQNVQEVFIELQEVQSSLSRRYFSNEQIESIQEAVQVNKKKKIDKELRGSISDKLATKLTSSIPELQRFV